MFILEKNANEAADRDCQSRVHLKGCQLLLATGIEETSRQMAYAGWDLNYSPFGTFENKQHSLFLFLSLSPSYFISYILSGIEVTRDHFPLNR